VDLARLRDKCARLQWSVDDIDWDAPGAERVDDAQATALGPFMADLYWIERVAATVFDAMARRETDPIRRGIFESFAADEQRHADAELQLMVRWGIMGRRQTPRPNPSVAKLLQTLRRNAHQIHPSVFSAIIPMTELVLDGALVKYLMRSVDDPLCHRVFDRINADEARHLAMDFHMLEHYGKHHSVLHNTFDMLRSVARPEALYALFFGYFPTLARSRASIQHMGLDIGEVAAAMRRYVELGQRNADIARHPTYRVMSRYVELVTDRRDPLGHALARISDAVDGFRGSPELVMSVSS
jgi:hypothetical protein